MNSTGEALSKPGKDMPSFEHALSNWPSDVAGSHIWDRAVRREVKETKMTEQHVSTYGWEVLICRTLKSFKLWGVPSLGPLHCRGFPSMGVLKMHAL